MAMKILSCLFAAAALLVAGHALAGQGAIPRQPSQYEAAPAPQNGGSVLVASSHYAADVLHNMLSARLSKESPVLVASMVQLDDLEKTSGLGRVVMQQVGSRLSQYGYRIVDSRLRSSMVMRPHEGEFMLSRDVARLMQTEYAAQAVLVGSYTESLSAVYFSLRLIRLDDGAVVAAHEYYLPNRGEVRNLLRQDRRGTGDGSTWASFAGRPEAYAGNGVSLPPVKNLNVKRPDRVPLVGHVPPKGTAGTPFPATGAASPGVPAYTEDPPVMPMTSVPDEGIK